MRKQIAMAERRFRFFAFFDRLAAAHFNRAKAKIRSMTQPLNIPALVGCALLGAASSPAHAQPDKELQVKAAILYNLARFSEWPAISQAADQRHFYLCVSNDDPMRTALRALSDKPIHGRRLKVKSLRKPSQISAECQILYISKGNEWTVDLTAIARLGVLAIGDSDDFLDNGGGILICRHGTKLGFSINRAVMYSANVYPSSRILNLSAEKR